METIKSVTNCVTCGSECDVSTDGTTHYYVSKTEYFKAELKEAVELIEKVVNERNRGVSGRLILNNGLEDRLTSFLTKHKSKE